MTNYTDKADGFTGQFVIYVRGFFSQYTYVLTQYSRKHCRKWREQPNTITSNSSVTVVFKKKLLKSLVLYVVLVCVFTFFVPCCDVRYNFRIQTFGSFLPPIVLRRAYVAFTLFVCVHSSAQHILCCDFIRLVYHILPVSLDCPFLIALSIFSEDYYLKYNSPFYNISEVTGKFYRIRVYVNVDDISELGLACWYSTNRP